MGAKRLTARIGTLICVHDDHWFLANVLASLGSKVDAVVFVSESPWHSSAGNWKRCVQIAESAGAAVIVGDWRDEATHRRAGMAELARRGYTHALVLDSDEILESELRDALVKIADSDLADRVRCFMETYWSDTTHVVRPREGLAPVVLIKLGVVEHTQVRDFSGGRELVLGPEYGVMHHLSYAGPDERIKRKIDSWSHRDELVPGWWHRSWMGWKADPTIRDLHPTHPRAYGFIERIRCPSILAWAMDATGTDWDSQLLKWPEVSVVIPVFGGAEVLSMCLQSLAACEDLLKEITVVDDCSPEADTESVATVLVEHPAVRVIRNETNQGFAFSCNRGIEETSGEIVLFLNSDTIVPRSGLIALIEGLGTSGAVGAAGPMTNNAGYYQRLDPTYTSLDRMDLFASDLAQSQREDRDVDMLVGFCLAVRRRVLEEVGAFDLRFGRGLFEDTDLCYRIARAGYRLRLASKAYVHHWGSQSFGKAVDMGGLLGANGKVFQEKWARDIECGFASHLPGFAINESPVRFNHDRSPEKLDRELAAKVKKANITLCMIVKDEERVLDDCLTSAGPFFTQMVVVDTGSTDRTMEIAREHGAEVYEAAWQISYSAARNESLKYATNDWIMWIDADDTMPRMTGEEVIDRVLAAPKDVAGFFVPVQFVEDGLPIGTRVDHVKVFRNLPGIHFVLRIHEQVLPSVREHGRIEWINEPVLHSGYDTSEEGQRQKREREWKHLKLDLAENPNHPFVLFNFGMTHHNTGEHAEAIETLRRCLELADPGDSIVRKAYAWLVQSLDKLGRSEEALRVSETGLEVVPGDPELLFIQAQLHTDSGNLKRAREIYETMPTGSAGQISSLDIGIFGHKRLHNLGKVCLQQGDYLSARTAWQGAIASNPNGNVSAEALIIAALDNGDLRTANEALGTFYRVSGPSERWADLGERLHMLMGGDEAAEAFLRAACDQHPMAPGPAMPLARRLCQTGRDGEAMPMLRGLTEMGFSEAAFYLGVVAIRLGSLEEALSFMRRARDLEFPNPEAQEQIERLEAAIGPPKPPTAEKRAILLGPHIGKLVKATRRFSVVIVTYNSARTLETCLPSVLASLTDQDEVILIENASMDGTLALAKKLTKKVTGPSCRILKQAKNLGYSKAANLGILDSQGETVVLLNPDTEVYPGWIERLKNCLDRGYAAVGPLSDRVAGEQFVLFHVPKDARSTLQQLPELVVGRQGEHAGVRLVTGMCLMVARESFNQLGLLCEKTFLGADDLEFSWRLRTLGHRLGIAKDVFVRHEAAESFRSLPEDDRKQQVSASDFALVNRMNEFYGGAIPNSEFLFGCAIFQEALERDVK